MRTILLCVLVGSIGGCGDDGRPAVDAGRDTGARTDGAGAVRTATIRHRYLDDADDSRIEGVKVAVATDRGRFEGVSDAAGEVSIEIQYVVDRFDGIAAKEGHVIIAAVGYATTDRLSEELDGDVAIIRLVKVAPDMGRRVPVSLTATGVPTGGRWCAGLGQWLGMCYDEGAGFDQEIFQSEVDALLVDGVTGYAFDAAGQLYDFDEGTWTINATTGARSAVIAFDGTLEVTPTTRNITLTLPTDPESPFRTMTLPDDWQGYAAAVEPGTNLPHSALTDIQIMSDRVTLTAHVFPVAGEELVWGLAPYASFTEPIRSFRWFSMAPTEDTFTFLDVARVRDGDRYDAEIAWTAPADDVDEYFVQYINNADRLVISLRTRATRAQLPQIPAAYDREVSFPFPDAPGDVRVVARRGDVPSAEELYRGDGEVSTGPRRPIRF